MLDVTGMRMNMKKCVPNVMKVGKKTLKMIEGYANKRNINHLNVERTNMKKMVNADVMIIYTGTLMKKDVKNVMNL